VHSRPRGRDACEDPKQRRCHTNAKNVAQQKLQNTSATTPPQTPHALKQLQGHYIVRRILDGSRDTALVLRPTPRTGRRAISRLAHRYAAHNICIRGGQVDLEGGLRALGCCSARGRRAVGCGSL